jgi:hypothetical protein
MTATTLAKVAKLEKPAAMKALPSWTKKQELKELPDISPASEWEESTIDDRVALWTDALGDEQLAKTLDEMKTSEYPDATLPELVALEWLARHQIKFIFQQWLLGGRALKGGQVVDLLVLTGGGAIIIEVQGQFWHTKPGMIQHDAAQRLALLGITFQGRRISYVVAAWESKLVNKIQSIRDQVMNMALLGIELGM